MQQTSVPSSGQCDTEVSKIFSGEAVQRTRRDWFLCLGLGITRAPGSASYVIIFHFMMFMGRRANPYDAVSFAFCFFICCLLSSSPLPSSLFCFLFSCLPRQGIHGDATTELFPLPASPMLLHSILLQKSSLEQKVSPASLWLITEVGCSQVKCTASDKATILPASSFIPFSHWKKHVAIHEQEVTVNLFQLKSFPSTVMITHNFSQCHSWEHLYQIKVILQNSMLNEYAKAFTLLYSYQPL